LAVWEELARGAKRNQDLHGNARNSATSVALQAARRKSLTGSSLQRLLYGIAGPENVANVAR
jgi:hypothetical protein